jgi:hypothetical protein
VKKTEEFYIKKAKEQVANRYGFTSCIFGSNWNDAMMIAHRTKRQINMYEDVINLLGSALCTSLKVK